MCFKIAVLGNRKKIFKKRCGVSPCRDFLAHENDLVKCIKTQRRKKKSLYKMFKNNWSFYVFFFPIYLSEVHLIKKWFELFWITQRVGEYMYLPLKVIQGFRHENPFLQNSCDNKLNIRPAYTMCKVQIFWEGCKFKNDHPL